MKFGSYCLLLISALLLTACGDDDNTEPPAELTDFKHTHYLNLQWSASTDDEIEQQYLFIEPLLLKDRIVTAGRRGILNVYELEDGDELAEIKLGIPLSGGIGGTEDIWLVGSRNGELIAVSGSSEDVLWRTRVPSEILARPIVYNRNTVLVRTADGQILGLDIKTGRIHWNYSKAIPALTLRGSSPPILSRSHFYTGLENGRLIAMSPIDGEVVWDIALTVPEGRSEIQRLVDIDGRSELYGRVLYAASYHGRIAALDVTRGQILWSRKFSSNTGVSVGPDTVYSSDDRGHIWALDRNNGATLWKQDKLQARHPTRPVIFQDFLVVGDVEGYVHVMSRFDGSFVARTQVDSDGILIPPIVDGDRLLVLSRGGSLTSYTLNESAVYTDEELFD
ncbi:MAG: outer membrane protein assembly factor BamB [Thiotrichales bacterium]|nr:MAG: outer membrane protein assembly factor BamB [Thiotrichales bacterium]